MQISLNVTASGTHRHRWAVQYKVTGQWAKTCKVSTHLLCLPAADDVRKAVLLSRPFRTAVRCRVQSHWTEICISNQVNRFPQPFVVFHPSFQHSWNTDTEYTDHPPPRSAMSQVYCMEQHSVKMNCTAVVCLKTWTSDTLWIHKYILEIYKGHWISWQVNDYYWLKKESNTWFLLILMV